MTRLFGSWRAPALLALILAAGCDLSPTALDQLDSDGVARILQASGQASREPAHRVLFEAFARIERPDGMSPSQVPGLDSLFTLALLTEDRRAPAHAAALRQQHRVLLAAAWRAVDSGDEDAGQRSLAAARSFQASATVEILGPATSLLFVSLVDRARLRAEASVRRLDARHKDDMPRLLRMAASARDVEQDARKALAQGDAAKALDVGSHAAGLVNALVAQLPPH